MIIVQKATHSPSASTRYISKFSQSLICNPAIGGVGVASSKNAHPSVERRIRILMCDTQTKAVLQICNKRWLQDGHTELTSIISVQNCFRF